MLHAGAVIRDMCKPDPCRFVALVRTVEVVMRGHHRLQFDYDRTADLEYKP